MQPLDYLFICFPAFYGSRVFQQLLFYPHPIPVIFNCFDFDEGGGLSIDEVTLALKSPLTGLSKICVGEKVPDESTLEMIALDVRTLGFCLLLVLFQSTLIFNHIEPGISSVIQER